MTDNSNLNFTGEDVWREPITKALRHVVDPEVSLSIVDVGLIYGVDISQEKVHVRMTMTSAACPVTDMLIDEVHAELEQILRQGYATDAEEFVDGLVCVAVPVLGTGRRQVRCAVALQAPAARMPLAQALQQVPRLGEAAQALGRTWA